MRRRIHIMIMLLLLMVDSISAQDMHFAQYDICEMYINPAATGMYGRDGNYRITLDQRSQWSSLGVKPYLSTFVAFDMPYKYRDKKLGLGGYIINNNSGLAGYNKFTLMTSAAYDIIGS